MGFSGSPTCTDKAERRATPAARVPPGTQNDTVLVVVFGCIAFSVKGTPIGGLMGAMSASDPR